MSSMPRCEAASISTTSSEVPFEIATQAWQVLSGVVVGPSTQLTLLARMRAIDVLPVPRGPANRYACRTWSCSSAFRSVRTTASWPTTCVKSSGRYLRYSAVTTPFSQTADPVRLERPAARSVVEQGDPGWCRRRLLGSGGAAAPGRESLALLPSGSDAVRTLPVRGTRPSTPRVDDPCP